MTDDNKKEAVLYSPGFIKRKNLSFIFPIIKNIEEITGERTCYLFDSTWSDNEEKIMNLIKSKKIEIMKIYPQYSLVMEKLNQKFLKKV